MHNKQRGVIPILIIVVILAGMTAVGGGYYVVSKRAQVAEQERAKDASVATVVKSVETTAKATSTPKVKPKPKSVQPVVPIQTPAPVPAPTPAPASIYGSELKVYPYAGGWPVKVSSTVGVGGSIEILPGMSVVRVVPKEANGAEYTVTISGLPADKDLYVYTNGYRIEELKHTDAKGNLVFKLTIPQQFIITEAKS